MQIEVVVAPSSPAPADAAQRLRPRYYSRANLTSMPEVSHLDADTLHAVRVVSAVLPFKVNQYVVEDLIDWSRIPDDPMFRLTFPHRDMLTVEQFAQVESALTDRHRLAEVVASIRAQMNPHPAGQKSHNVPVLNGESLEGMQHKYRETVLFFPAQGQTCHSYCTFCFRWPQFVGVAEFKFASRQVESLVQYLAAHREVSDILITGGDPMVMPTEILKTYLEALLSPELEHVQSIRIGTKSITYWPYRYFRADDSDALMRLFEKVVASGKHLALMAHFNHFRELSTPAAHQAIERIRATGAVIRCQSPLVRHINDSPDVWARMWRDQVRLGCVPYYMFVERDTGPKKYFEVPLVQAWKIYTEAVRQVSGLARTVRGPSMSATPGKVAIDGVVEIGGGKRALALRFLQARRPEWVNRPFLAGYDEQATWLSELRPYQGDRFFFEEEAAPAPTAGLLTPS